MASIEKNQSQSKKSNGRGGKRANAGRKVGSATKKTREIADRAAATGVTPLEIMLASMWAFAKQAKKEKDAGLKLRLMAQAADVAKDAAPYMHPRLNAIEHTGPGGGPVETVSRIELVAPH